MPVAEDHVGQYVIQGGNGGWYLSNRGGAWEPTLSADVAYFDTRADAQACVDRTWKRLFPQTSFIVRRIGGNPCRC